jgi:hypothetical protein
VAVFTAYPLRTFYKEYCMKKYTDPDEVMAQLHTFSWLLGNMNSDNAPSEEYKWGLYLLGNMIADNVGDLIAHCKNRTHDPDNK